MKLTAFDDFIDDCFLGKDPICEMHLEESLWLDHYASKLIAEKEEKSFKNN